MMQTTAASHSRTESSRHSDGNESAPHSGLLHLYIYCRAGDRRQSPSSGLPGPALASAVTALVRTGDVQRSVSVTSAASLTVGARARASRRRCARGGTADERACRDRVTSGGDGTSSQARRAGIDRFRELQYDLDSRPPIFARFVANSRILRKPFLSRSSSCSEQICILLSRSVLYEMNLCGIMQYNAIQYNTLNVLVPSLKITCRLCKLLFSATIVGE